MSSMFHWICIEKKSTIMKPIHQYTYLLNDMITMAKKFLQFLVQLLLVSLVLADTASQLSPPQHEKRSVVVWYSLSDHETRIDRNGSDLRVDIYFSRTSQEILRKSWSMGWSTVDLKHVRKLNWVDAPFLSSTVPPFASKKLQTIHSWLIVDIQSIA